MSADWMKQIVNLIQEYHNMNGVTPDEIIILKDPIVLKGKDALAFRIAKLMHQVRRDAHDASINELFSVLLAQGAFTLMDKFNRFMTETTQGEQHE